MHTKLTLFFPTRCVGIFDESDTFNSTVPAKHIILLESIEWYPFSSYEYPEAAPKFREIITNAKIRAKNAREFAYFC